MKFTKVIKADENFWSKENLKFNLVSDIFKAIEDVMNHKQHGAYKVSFKDGIITKEDILSAIEEASIRFEEVIDEI